MVEAIEQLKPDDRTVIELRHFENMTFAAIGEQMDRSESAAQILHSRALVRLGIALRKLMGQGNS